MKVGIIGYGAIGCLFASLLNRAGNDVVLIGNNLEKVKYLNNCGITLLDGNYEYNFKIPVFLDSEVEEIFDLIIIAVKAYNIISVVDILKRSIFKGTPVLSVQNGLGHIEVLLTAVQSLNLFIGVTTQGAMSLGVGKVKRCGKGEIFIAPIDRSNYELSKLISDLFNRASISSLVFDDYLVILWSKLVINAGICPVSILSGLTNGEILANQEWSNIMFAASFEAQNVAKALNIRLIFSDVKEVIKKVCIDTKDNVSSMLQDFRNGKPTEIDFINGAIINTACSLNIDTPINLMLYKKVKSLSV